MARSLVGFLALALTGAELVLVHPPATVPEGWSASGENVEYGSRLDVLVGVRRSNAEKLDEAFWEVSTPGRAGYLQHLSWAAMGKLVRPDSAALSAVLTWLAEHGAVDVRLAGHGDYVRASIVMEELESMTSGTFSSFAHAATGRKLARLTGGVRLPAELAVHVETFTGFHGFPLDPSVAVLGNQSAGSSGVTPSVINSAYSIGNVKNSSPNRQAIAQFQGQYTSQKDLTSFCKQYKADGGDCEISKYVGKNTPTQPGVESMLDTEYIMGVGTNADTWVYSYPSFDFCNDLLTWASDVASEPDHPFVVSLSYGSQKIDFCDKATSTRLSTDTQKLGAMGITVLIASGDDGSGGATRQGSNNGKLSPSFPASIPYVLAVGSTYFQSGSSGPEQATTQFGSGGGFSYDFDVPSYQTSTVSAYLAKNPKTGSKDYAKTGRGSPDVAALGEQFQVVDNGKTLSVGGTSASTPTWGGIVSLLNDACLTASAGKKTLGFVNPLFYQNPDAFTDITVGSNAIGSNAQSGWKCTEGWDAATGLGTPKFDKLQAVVQKACSAGLTINV